MQNNLTPEAPQGEAVYEVSAEQVKANLKAAMKSTGSTFYWIAGLSLLNTVLVLTKANIMMLGGLGLTLVVDVLFSQAGAQIQPIGFGINITIALMFVALGMWAGKGNKVAFYIGMSLYALDACLYLFIQDWVNIAFHGYFLYLLYGGLKGVGILKQSIAEVDAKIAAQQA
jgi:hypothetical protein